MVTLYFILCTLCYPYVYSRRAVASACICYVATNNNCQHEAVTITKPIRTVTFPASPIRQQTAHTAEAMTVATDRTATLQYLTDACTICLFNTPKWGTEPPNSLSNKKTGFLPLAYM